MNDLHHPCEHWAEPISLAAAGCLAPDEDREVRRHIEACSECRERYRQLTELCGALAEAQLPADSAEAAIVERIISAVASEATQFDFHRWAEAHAEEVRTLKSGDPPTHVIRKNKQTEIWRRIMKSQSARAAIHRQWGTTFPCRQSEAGNLNANGGK